MFVIVALALLRASVCEAGVFVSTNSGYPYFTTTQLSELQFAGALAADIGSGTLVVLLNDGVVSNSTSGGGSVNPPSGLSSVTAISVNADEGVLALTSSGTVVGWGYDAPQVPAGLSNVVAISLGQGAGLALLNNGMVTGLGTSVPAGLSNVVAIDAWLGYLALEANGTVVAWGSSALPPIGLSNVIAVCCGKNGNLALLANGSVIGWNSSGVQTNLLAPGVTNTVAISGDYSAFMALQADGSVVIGGNSPLFSFAEPLANVISLGRIDEQAIVVEGDGLPSFTVQPRSQIVAQGGTIYLHARTAAPESLFYQWQCNGTNLPGSTNRDLILTNAAGANAGDYQAIVSFSLGGTPYWAGSSVATITVLPPPPIPILLTAPVLQTNGSLTIAANAPAGGSFPLTNSSQFVLQASSDLLNWTALTNNLTVTNGAINFTDPAAMSTPARFYRLLDQP